MLFFLQIIKKPVDIAKIQQRIDDEKYEDMSALQKVNINIDCIPFKWPVYLFLNVVFF